MIPSVPIRIIIPRFRISEAHQSGITQQQQLQFTISLNVGCNLVAENSGKNKPIFPGWLKRLVKKVAFSTDSENGLLKRPTHLLCRAQVDLICFLALVPFV